MCHGWSQDLVSWGHKCSLSDSKSGEKIITVASTRQDYGSGHLLFLPTFKSLLIWVTILIFREPTLPPQFLGVKGIPAPASGVTIGLKLISTKSAHPWPQGVKMNMWPKSVQWYWSCVLWWNSWKKRESLCWILSLEDVNLDLLELPHVLVCFLWLIAIPQTG